MECVLVAGDLSRNRTVGLRIGKGEKWEDIKKTMTAVAEGILTSRWVSLARSPTPVVSSKLGWVVV